MSRLERVLAGSPADRTEISWVELRSGREGTAGRREGADSGARARPSDPSEHTDRTVVVRVWERGRSGSHRTGAGSLSELAAAVREALGQARLAPSIGYPQPAAPSRAAEPATAGAPPALLSIPAAALFDPAIAALAPPAARELLLGWTERGETASLGWAEGQVTFAASDGRRSAVRATAASLEVRGQASGSAAGASRTLDGLDGAGIAARSRRRSAAAESRGERPAEPPAGLSPLLLSPEAAAALIGLLNRTALTSAAYRDLSSPLCGRLGTALFAPAISLADDATDPRGLPFPFDLTGSPKRPIEMIRDGVALTPAIDEPLAAALGRPATPHALSADEGLATNLFLRPGGRSEEDLMREVGDAGGVWVGSLDAIELYDPAGHRFRARLVGVRRIAGDAMAGALPDMLWEDALPAALSRVIGVGDSPLVVGAGAPLLLLLGAISSPALALDPRGRSAALYPAPS